MPVLRESQSDGLIIDLRSLRGYIIQAQHIREKQPEAQRGYMTYQRPHSSQGKWQTQKEAEPQSRDPRSAFKSQYLPCLLVTGAKNITSWSRRFFHCEVLAAWHTRSSTNVIPFLSYWDSWALLESTGGQDLSLRDLFTVNIKIGVDGRECVQGEDSRCV